MEIDIFKLTTKRRTDKRTDGRKDGHYLIDLAYKSIKPITK